MSNQIIDDYYIHEENENPNGNNNTIFNYTGGVPNRHDGIGITHINIHENVNTITNEAFWTWEDVVSVQMTSSVQVIGDEAFYMCKKISSLTLSTSLQRIGQDVFERCEQLSNITLPESLTDMGKGAFRYCSALERITIPSSITTIPGVVFYECSSLSKVFIPTSVISIAECAFMLCTKLKTIQIPNTVQTIHMGAFNSCSSLESIQIPPCTTSIESFAFLSCSSLKVVYAPSVLLQQDSAEIKVFYDCHPNLIILTDTNGLEYEEIHTITLDNIQQCLNDLPNYKGDNDNSTAVSRQIAPSPKEQWTTLHNLFHERFPHVSQQATQSNFNLLHLLVYYPGNIYQPLHDILTKCGHENTTTAIDNNGKTPLHHAIESTKHNMNPECYDLLLTSSPDTVVNLAIRAGMDWDGIYHILTHDNAKKMNALAVEDLESGLLPFMMVAAQEEDRNTNSRDELLGLSVVYDLLCLKPDVLKRYDTMSMYH